MAVAKGVGDVVLEVGKDDESDRSGINEKFKTRLHMKHRKERAVATYRRLVEGIKSLFRKFFTKKNECIPLTRKEYIGLVMQHGALEYNKYTITD